MDTLKTTVRITRRSRNWLVGSALCATLVAGGFAAVALASEGSGKVDVATDPYEYPVNANGMSYGSAESATSPDNEPDLITAYGIDGTLGYVKKTDLYLPAPASPQEAIAQNDQVIDHRRSIPLYAQDGVKVIGSFTIDTPASSVHP